MSFLYERKYTLIGIGIISLLFILSIQIRLSNLKAPLSRNHEWITAHALMTAEIWDQNGGPSQYGFKPVYTYSGLGNRNDYMLGGLGDVKEDVYYISYPPFAYLYLYYFSQFSGGPTVMSARSASLSLHFLTAILLFFLLGSLRPEHKKNTFNFAGIIAGGIYLFAQGNLWFHGNLFFVDMVVQPLFISGLLLTMRYLKGTYKNEKITLTLLFCVFFLATYTEWLGLLSAFCTGLLFLGFAIVKKQRRYLRPFFIIGLGSALALTTTVAQYNSIAGWENLKKASLSKYAERSGHDVVIETDAAFSLTHEGSIVNLKKRFDRDYKSAENYLGFSVGFIILVFLVSRLKFFKQRTSSIELKWPLILLLLVIPPLFLHYFLFFNFNAMHSFSEVKTSGLLVILIALIVQLTETLSANMNRYFLWGTWAFFSVIFVHKSNDAVDRYLADNPLENVDLAQVNSGIEIAKLSGRDDVVFTNTYLTPVHAFYAKHNLTPLQEGDTLVAKTVMKLRHAESGHYYHHDGNTLKYMLPMRLQHGNLVFSDTLFFN